MGARRDTAASAGAVGFTLYIIFFATAFWQCCLYISRQKDTAQSAAPGNKTIFLLSISLWALLDACYYFGLWIDDSISAWAYSCHVLALTAALVAFCEVVQYWSRALSFRGQYQRIRKAIRQILGFNVLMVVVTLIVLGISGSYDHFAEHHPQINATFQTEQGFCMLLLSVWMLWHGVYLQRRFMTATSLSLQDPFGLARVTLHSRPQNMDRYSSTESDGPAAGHVIEEPGGQEDEDVLTASAERYEQQLLLQQPFSSEDERSCQHQDTVCTYDTTGTPLRKDLLQQPSLAMQDNAISHLDVIIRINAVLTSCCICFLLRMVLLAVAAFDSIMGRHVTDDLMWLTWFLLSCWIPLLVPGFILLHVMRPTALPSSSGMENSSAVYYYSEHDNGSADGHYHPSSSLTTSSKPSLEVYEISDDEENSFSTVSVSTNEYIKKKNLDDVYIPPEFSRRNQETNKKTPFI